MVVRVRDWDANSGTFSEPAGSWKLASSGYSHVCGPPDVGVAADGPQWGP